MLMRKICNAKLLFEEYLAENNYDTKSLYAYIQSKQKTKDSVGQLQDEEGNTIDSPLEMVEYLNTSFASIFSIYDNTKPHLPIHNTEYSSCKRYRIN